MSTDNSFTLWRNEFGRLMMRDGSGTEHPDVSLVRANPVSAPQDGIAVLGQDGHELAWIEHIAELPDELRKLVEESLQAREFMPEILRLIGVSSFATPSTWEVETNRGRTSFVLKGEEDIHRLTDGVLLISDAHGIQFMIRKLAELDRNSRRLLDRFL